MGDTLRFDPTSRRRRPQQPSTAKGRAAVEAGRYVGALMAQRTERLIATGKIVPARITLALDFRRLEGPEVDLACGAQEPDVDLWECGLAVPTAEQLVKLAALTNFPIGYFYLPIKPGPLVEGIIICYKGKRGCERPETSRVDENGVLHYPGETRQPPSGAYQQILNLDDLL